MRRGEMVLKSTAMLVLQMLSNPHPQLDHADQKPRSRRRDRGFFLQLYYRYVFFTTRTLFYYRDMILLQRYHFKVMF